jgi:hypothetical protein
VIFFSCNQKEYQKNLPKLLFKSGFENNVEIISNPDPDSIDYDLILGMDLETNFSWPINILGAQGSGLHYIDDDNKQATYSEIQSTIGPYGTITKTLYSKENYTVDATQCPYEILNIIKGKTDLYIKYWMKLDSESLHQINKWRAIFEYKTKDYGSGTGYRLIAFIYTNNQGNPYWHFQGDANPQNPVWEYDNYEIPVPENEWFETEFYWKWGDNENGRSLWKINGQIVADHYGATTLNSKPIDFIILTQIYGDANPKHQWIDDIEIWSGLPE